jgi:hypothetical protein
VTMFSPAALSGTRYMYAKFYRPAEWLESRELQNVMEERATW